MSTNASTRTWVQPLTVLSHWHAAKIRVVCTQNRRMFDVDVLFYHLFPESHCRTVYEQNRTITLLGSSDELKTNEEEQVRFGITPHDDIYTVSLQCKKSVCGAM